MIQYSVKGIVVGDIAPLAAISLLVTYGIVRFVTVLRRTVFLVSQLLLFIFCVIRGSMDVNGFLSLGILVDGVRYGLPVPFVMLNFMVTTLYYTILLCSLYGWYLFFSFDKAARLNIQRFIKQ